MDFFKKAAAKASEMADHAGSEFNKHSANISESTSKNLAMAKEKSVENYDYLKD